MTTEDIQGSIVAQGKIISNLNKSYAEEVSKASKYLKNRDACGLMPGSYNGKNKKGQAKRECTDTAESKRISSVNNYKNIKNVLLPEAEQKLETLEAQLAQSLAADAAVKLTAAEASLLLAEQGLSAEALFQREVETGTTSRYELDLTEDSLNVNLLKEGEVNMKAKSVDIANKKKVGILISSIVGVILIVTVIVLVKKFKK